MCLGEGGEDESQGVGPGDNEEWGTGGEHYLPMQGRLSLGVANRSWAPAAASTAKPAPAREFSKCK